LTSVNPEIVDFGSEQGLNVFATAGIVLLFRGLQKSEKRSSGPKDAISGWTPTIAADA
jgi:hypothetical protein